MLERIGNGLYSLFDLLTVPWGAHPDRALAFVSLLCGVATIFIFKAASNPATIRGARNHITAHILEMRIYQNDLTLILRGLGSALASNLDYLRAVAWPIVLVAALMVIAFTQLEARFAQAPLRPGDVAVVTVTCSPGADVMAAMATGNGGAVVDPGRVRVPGRREVIWRAGIDPRQFVGSDRPTISIHLGNAIYDLPLAASPEFSITDGTQRSQSALSGLLHPGLPDLPKSSPIERIEIEYPPARHSLFGWQTHWVLVFAAWSLIGAAVPKLLLRIQI